MSIQNLTASCSSLSIAKATKLLRVPRSSYYYWNQYSTSGRARNPEEEMILEEIKNICGEFAGYGYRRMTVELKNRGFFVNHKRVQKLMRENGLQFKREHDSSL